MKRMKRGKAIGPDDIAWKAMGRTAVEWLTEVFRKNLETEHMPDEWRASTLIPAFKNKGDIQDCGNNRGIKLTSHTLMMWERIIDKRLRNRVGVSEQQFSFMPSRSTTNAIFALRQEVAEEYIRLLQMYEGSKTLVRCATGDTEEFEVTVGLYQGSALSPFLFAVISDCRMGDVQKQAPWDMLFTDDVMAIAEAKEEVEQRLELWREAMEVRGRWWVREGSYKTDKGRLGTMEENNSCDVLCEGEDVQRDGEAGDDVRDGGGSCNKDAGRKGCGNKNVNMVTGTQKTGESQK
ncbi:uncharacterized protein LOC134774760 [Penaeus indicus]|uniref:uncharacterized protein LOC134774760 n=1 Tax=Penaeus indicus TaxID=29960 RepID=UPI00300D1041